MERITAPVWESPWADIGILVGTSAGSGVEVDDVGVDEGNGVIFSGFAGVWEETFQMRRIARRALKATSAINAMPIFCWVNHFLKSMG